MFPDRDLLITVLRRGLFMKCPRCGLGSLYIRWHQVAESCSHCDYELEKRVGDCWFFMMMTNALITGFGFLFMIFLYRPENLFVGRAVVVVIWLSILLVSLPLRKGIAIAIDYLIDPLNRKQETETQGK